MNAIAKAAFEHARELAKLPTVEQIREIVVPEESTIDGLIARVDVTLALYGQLPLERAAERFCTRANGLWNQLCRHCHQPYHAHSTFGDYCPQPYPKPMHTTRFSVITCQACTADSSGDPGQQCEQVCVPGREFCNQHLVE